MRQLFSIKTTISIIVFFSILSVSLPLLFLVIRNSNDIVRISEDENFKRLVQIIKWEIEDEIEYASFSLQSIAQDETVKELLLERDRLGLYEHLIPNYALIRERIIRFHIHLPDGVSFLRVHNPSMYGDSLTEIRPMILHISETRTELRGIEEGREGFSMRVMLPILSDEEFIGSVEYGMDFGNEFLSRIQSRYDGEYFLYKMDMSGTYSLIASTGGITDCIVTENDLDSIRNKRATWSEKCSGMKNVGLIPVIDYSGMTKGFIKVEFPRDQIIQNISTMARQFGIVSIATAFIITLIVLLALVYILFRPLRRVVAQTSKISTEIQKGNLHFRGNVDMTAVDFKEIIQAINDIIATLRDREGILKAIIDGFPGIVYYLDNNCRVLWANETAKMIAGREIIGTRLTDDRALQGFFEIESDLLSSTMKEGEIKSKSACYYHRSDSGGKEKCWEHRAIPIFDQEKDVKNILRISTDISDKEEAQAKLRKLNATLEKRVVQEVQKRKEQENKAYHQSRLASIGELAAGIAHEINQPLNAITFAIENVYNRFLEGTIEKEYFKKKIKSISGDIDRTRRIIEHVRTFARESSDEYRINFSVNQCVQNALSMVGVQFATHGIDIEKDLADDLPMTCGNPFQYEQVVLNLLSNARDAVEERAQRDSYSNVSDPLPLRIEVRTREAGGHVRLEVCDNGIGVSEEIINKVFDPFFTTKEPGKGTGLGLSISYGIIQKIEGSIDIIPLKPGTKIRVEVPKKAEPCRQ